PRRNSFQGRTWQPLLARLPPQESLSSPNSTPKNPICDSPALGGRGRGGVFISGSATRPEGVGPRAPRHERNPSVPTTATSTLSILRQRRAAGLLDHAHDPVIEF